MSDEPIRVREEYYPPVSLILIFYRLGLLCDPKTIFTLMPVRFHLALFSVMPKTLSVVVWTLPFSYRLIHEDDSVYVFFWIHFRERFHTDAISPKSLSVLVWTEGLNASKGVRFQTKHSSADRAKVSKQ